MFSWEPLSVPCMPMSVLVALGLCMAWAGVTGRGSQGRHSFVLTPTACLSKGIHRFNIPRMASERWGSSLTNTPPWEPRAQIQEGYPDSQKAEGIPQCSSGVLEGALCSCLPKVCKSRAQSQTRFCTLCAPGYLHPANHTHPLLCFHSSLVHLNIILHQGSWLCI